MSEYIFDQVYGSEAKKRKILQNSNFLYYRQIMKIKNNHLKNPSLYSQLYELPNQSKLSSPYNKSKLSYSPDFLSTLSQNNYAVQKLNSHAFKIIRRKQKAPPSKNNQTFNKTITNNKFLISSGRKLTSRTIDRDANDLRNYLNPEQRGNSKTQNRHKNLSVQLSTDKNLRTISTFRRTQRQSSPFSTIRHSGNSGISFKKY